MRKNLEQVVRERFERERKRQPLAGSIVCLSLALLGTGARKWDVRRAFDTLVPPDEYAPEEKEEILRFLRRMGRRKVL